MKKYSASISEGVEQLKQETEQKFTVLMKYGTMQLQYFSPEEVDTQTPHLQDEIYLITSGESDFYRNGETIKCKTNDVLFVPAGMEHRFINFSNDFATWVIFYGPDGGEQ